MNQATQPPSEGYTLTIPGSKSSYTLTIPGRLPGLNEYTNACRTNPRAGARMKQEAQDAALWCIKAQMRGCRFKRPVFLIFHFYEQDRRRDRDNVGSFARKVIQDALVKSGALIDDSWAYVSGYLDSFEVDRKRPRIVVEFIEQEDEACSKLQKQNSKK